MLIYFIEAFTNLAATKLRAVLAMLGILVGTASVVAMVSSGQLATQQALAQFKTLGTDMMAVAFYSESASDTANKRNFDLKQVMGLQSATSAIRILAPYVMLYAPISYHGKVIEGSIVGATANLQAVIKINLGSGLFISDWDG